MEQSIEIGDRVLINANGTWHKEGSDSLPKWERDRILGDRPFLPIAAFDGNMRLFLELIDFSTLKAFSQDRHRAKVRNDRTGRISVFRVTDLVFWSRH